MVRAAGAHASTLARLICPASSTTRTSSAGAGRANSGRLHVHATAPTTSIVPDRRAASTSALSAEHGRGRVGRRLPGLRLLADADRLPELDRRLRDLVEDLADDLVAVGDDPDPPALADQVARSSARRCRSCPNRAAPGSAGRRRPSSGPRGSPRRRPSRRRRRTGPPGAWPAAGGVRSRRAVAPRPGRRPRRARARRPGAPSAAGSRPAPCSGRRPSGRSTGGAASPANVGPRLIVIVRATSSTAITSPADCPRPRVVDVAVLADPVVLGRERERVARSTAWRPARWRRARGRRAARAPRAARRRSCPSARSSATRPTCPRAGARSAAGRGASGRPPRGRCARSTGSSGTPAVSRAEIPATSWSRSLELGRRGAVADHGPRQRHALARLEVAPPVLEPVAEPPVAHHVVAVVARDPVEDRGRRPRPAPRTPARARSRTRRCCCPASFSSTSRSSAYSGSMRLIE